jgi:hypothetical protein
MPQVEAITQESCHASNKVWIPISLEKGTAECGEDVASFSCDKTTVLATFYTAPADINLKNDLTDEINSYEGLSFKMNDCGKVSDTHYRIHWYQPGDGVNALYEVTEIQLSGP